MSDAIENENLSSVQDEAQADELLSSIETEGGGPIQDQAPTQTPLDEFELSVGGKAIKAKRDQVLQWAQMGYDAPNKIRMLSRERDEFKTKYSDFENKIKEYESKYGEIDGYVRQNPQFWDHVVNSYQQRNQALQDASNPLAGVVAQLQQQVQSLVSYKDQIEQRQAQAQEQAQDQAYLQTLESIQKSYPDIDFVTPDAEGKTLEYKVLEHGIKNGFDTIKDPQAAFRAAFRDYFHDELMKRGETKAKESVLKEKQKQTKLGILGISPTPTKQAARGDIRKKSYDDLAAEVKQELGI